MLDISAVAAAESASADRGNLYSASVKREGVLTSVGQLNLVPPLHPPKAVANFAPAFDLAVVFFESGVDLQSVPLRERKTLWLQEELPEVFPNARILTYGYDSQGLNESSSVDNREKFALKFLHSLHKLRETTFTTDRPLVILVHITGGDSMLGTLLLILLIVLDNSVEHIRLKASTRGVVCLNGTNNDSPFLPAFSITSLTATYSEKPNDWLSNNTQSTIPARGLRIPLTVFSDEEDTSGKGFESWLARHVDMFNVIHVALDISYPSRASSVTRISGEILKCVTWGPRSSLESSRAAAMKNYLRPVKSLFQYDEPDCLEEAGSWLLNEPSFGKWHDLQPDNQSWLLWIYGKPGSGKTVLMKQLVSNLRKSSVPAQPPSTVACLFFDYRWPLQQHQDTARGTLLRTILYQMLENETSVPPISPLWGFPSAVSKQLEELHHSYYQRFFLDMLFAATRTSTMFLILDGLDEFGPDVREDVLDFVDLIRTASQSGCNVRVAVTSRYNPTWGDRFPTTRIQLDENNSQDIANFCLGTLSSHLTRIRLGIDIPTPYLSNHRSRKSVMQQVVDELTAKAAGCFVWVRLALNTILRPDDPGHGNLRVITENWYKTVQKIPFGLNSSYMRLLEGISIDHTSKSRLILLWCVFARRPLTVDEMDAALRYSDGCFKSKRIYRKGMVLDAVQNELCGLVEIRRGQLSDAPEIQLVHMTARDFLLADGLPHIMPGYKSLEVAEGFAQALIADVCVRCLEYNLSAPMDTPHTFIDYSSRYWGFHARAADKPGVAQTYLGDMFRWPFEHETVFWFGTYHLLKVSGPSPSKRTSLLHIASYHGILSVAKRLRPDSLSGKALGRPDGFGFQPLHYAVASSHVDTVSMLLDHGAPINAPDNEGCTPLHMAARHGYRAALRLLLNAGARADAKDAMKMTPLLVAAKLGQLDIVKALLEAGADIDASLPDGSDALSLAIASRNHAVAEFILRERIRQNAEWSSKSAETMLVAACSLGLEDVVRDFLLDHRLTDTPARFVRQALIASVSSASEVAATLLLDAGCDPDTRDHEHGQAALSIAVASGSESIVELLLKHGADPNAEDTNTRNTPIMHAISRGFLNIVKRLLKYGARMDFPTQGSALIGSGWIFRVIAHLMRTCHKGAGSENHDQGSGNSSTESVKGSPTEGSTQLRPVGQGSRRGKRSGDDGGAPEDDASETKRICSRSGPKKFACPFQKMDPHKHKCPSFPTISRLKSHIYDNHGLLYVCICGKGFKSNEDFFAHVQAKTCNKQNKQDRDYSEGIDQKQKDELKSRVGFCKLSDEQKWMHVFDILFPNCPRDKIPSSNFEDGSKYASERLSFLEQLLKIMEAPNDMDSDQRYRQMREAHRNYKDSTGDTDIGDLPATPPAPNVLKQLAMPQSSLVDLPSDGCGDVQDNLFVPTHGIGSAANLEQEYAGRQYIVPLSDSGFVTHASDSMDQYPLDQNPQGIYHFESQQYTPSNSIWDERNMAYGYASHDLESDLLSMTHRPAVYAEWQQNNAQSDERREDEGRQDMIRSGQHEEDEE